MSSEKCKTRLCKSEAAAGDTYRGLCLKCYSSAKKMVEGGKSTWIELADMGLCTGGPQSEFERAFAEAKSKQ